MSARRPPHRRSQKPETVPPQRKIRWPYLVLALAILAVYWQSLAGAFVLDDSALYRDSPSLSDASSIVRGFTLDVGAVRKGSETAISSYYRPVFLALSTLYYQVVGASPRAWHGAAVALAIVVGWLAYAWFLTWGWSARLAFWGALVFSLHPAHVSSVAWVSGIQELLAAVFCLSAVLALRSSKPLALGAVFFALGLLSKEVSAALFPLVFGGYLIARRDPSEAPWTDRLRRATKVFATVLLVYLAVRLAVLGGLTQEVFGAPSLGLALRAVPLALLTYLRMLLLPFEFSIFRPERPDFVASALPWFVTVTLVVGLAALAAVAVRRRRDLGPPLLWWLAWLAPVLNLWALPAQWMVSDRYLFLPSLALPWVLLILLPRKAITPSLAVLALVFAVASVRYAAIFADEPTFVAAMEKAEPTSSILAATQGDLRRARGDAAGARVAYARAVELDPHAAAALLALGDLERAAGDYDQAERHYRQALPVRPYASKPFKLLAIDLSRAGYVGRATDLIEDAARRWPEDFEVRLLQALLLGQASRRAEAEAAFATASRLRPNDPALAGGFEATRARLAATIAPSLGSTP